MNEAYYEVPVGRGRSVTLERGGRLGVTLAFPEVEETVWDHASAAAVGLVVFAAGSAILHDPAAVTAMMFGGFFAGWAANNAVIAWRCERRENAEEAES